MTITYSAGTGTTITTFAADDIPATSQTQQTGNNTVVMSDSFTNLSNGNHGDGTNGVGATYVGRLVVVNPGASQQVRMCISQTTGTGTTYILTVHEDWDTNPTTSDNVYVCYELADIEDGGASGGIGLGSKTGLWELSNDLIIGNATDLAGLQIVNGAALETDDNGANINSYVENNGCLYMGYEGAGAPINGGVCTAYNNTAAEPWMQFKSGSFGWIYDSFFWAQLVAQKLELVNGSDITWWGSKIFSGTQELHLYDATLTDCTVAGRAAGTSEIVRIDAGTTVNGLVLSNVDTIDTVADTTTETLEIEGVIFSGVTDLINVRNNKTWNVIDPVWSATTYTDFVWVGSTSNAVNDRRSIKATVQTPAGTKLQNANVIVYEGTQLDDLVLELNTDTNGYAADSFIYKAHATNSSTTTYGAHALRVDNWLYVPFVAAQTSTEAFNGVVTLLSDSNISETTQATAKTNGSGITWNEDTNPSSIIAYTGGSGTLSVGDTVTGGTSTADGVVTKIVSGDSTAGTVHLKTRDANNFSGTEGLSNGTGWTATLTSGSQQDFSIWIDGDTKTLQVIYDYLAALTSENTLTSTGELIHEWGRDSQGRALYATGSSFYTERSNAKGIFISDYGAGTVDYFTDDTGTTWTPPSTTTVTFTGMKDNSEVRVYLTGTSTAVAGIEDATSGTTDDRSFAWSTTASTVVDYVIHCFQPGDEIYESIRVEGYTVPASNTSIAIQQRLDRNAEN